MYNAHIYRHHISLGKVRYGAAATTIYCRRANVASKRTVMHCSDSNILLSNADHCICTLAHCNVQCASVYIVSLEHFIALHE